MSAAPLDVVAAAPVDVASPRVVLALSVASAAPELVGVGVVLAVWDLALVVVVANALAFALIFLVS